MDMLGKYGAFVNDQVRLQERLARKFENIPWRQELHQKSCQTYKELADDLILIQSRLNDTPHPDLKPSNVLKNITLSLEDIEGLPPELMQELSISEADRLEFTIVGLINEAGGVLSLDKVLVGLYRKTGEIHKRSTLTSRLYRMAGKGLIYNVPNRKGVYSTQEITEDDVKRLFAPEVTESAETS